MTGSETERERERERVLNYSTFYYTWPRIHECMA